MEKHITKLTANEHVIKFLEKSGTLARQLPEWKQGVLEASSRPSNSQPRPPVEGKSLEPPLNSHE